MGFALDILLEIQIDPSTGEPFPVHTVLPQRFLRFIHLKGSYLTCYVPEESDRLRANPQELLNSFPSWETVAECVVLPSSIKLSLLPFG